MNALKYLPSMSISSRLFPALVGFAAIHSQKQFAYFCNFNCWLVDTVKLSMYPYVMPQMPCKPIQWEHLWYSCDVFSQFCAHDNIWIREWKIVFKCKLSEAIPSSNVIQRLAPSSGEDICVLASGIPTAFLVFISRPMLSFISSVRMIGTFRPRFPLISTMSNLNKFKIVTSSTFLEAEDTLF